MAPTLLDAKLARRAGARMVTLNRKRHERRSHSAGLFENPAETAVHGPSARSGVVLKISRDVPYASNQASTKGPNLRRELKQYIFVITASLCVMALGCSVFPMTPAHIVHGPGGNPMIIDGKALAIGEIPLEGVTRIVIPNERATIMEGEPSDSITVFISKSLNGANHPPDLQDIADFQHGMGCCYRRVGDRLEITSFGEFHRAGTLVRLALVIPKGVAVETNSSLAASESDLNGMSPMSPGGDWLELEDTPDPEGAKATRTDEWPREWFVAK